MEGLSNLLNNVSEVIREERIQKKDKNVVSTLIFFLS